MSRRPDIAFDKDTGAVAGLGMAVGDGLYRFVVDSAQPFGYQIAIVSGATRFNGDLPVRLFDCDHWCNPEAIQESNAFLWFFGSWPSCGDRVDSFKQTFV